MDSEIDWNMVDVQFEYEPSYEGDVFIPSALNDCEVVSVVYLGEQRPDLYNYIEQLIKE